MGRMYDPDAAEAVVWVRGREWHILRGATEAWAIQYGAPIKRHVDDLFADWLVDRAHTLFYVHQAAGVGMTKRVEVEYRMHPAVWAAILRGSDGRGQPYIGNGMGGDLDEPITLYGIPVAVDLEFNAEDIELVLSVKS